MVKSRSGNPGYLPGKPILMGFLVKNESGENFFIQRNDSSFLSVMKTSLSCDDDLTDERYEKISFLLTPWPNESYLSKFRHLVKFGENYYSGCTIQLSQSELYEQCDLIKNRIIGKLVGIGDEEIDLISKYKSGRLLILSECIPIS